MKKIILSAVLLFGILSLHAQLDKGQFLVGGNMSFSHKTQKHSTQFVSIDNKQTTLDITPDIGYFFMDRLAGGIRIGISSSKTDGVTDGRNATPLYIYVKTKERISATVFAPFVRYYFLPKVRRVNILGELSYVHADGKNRQETFTSYIDPNSQLPANSLSKSTQDFTTNGFSVAAGPAFFINKFVSLELTLAYLHQAYTRSDGAADDIFAAGLGLQIHLAPGKIQKK